MKCDVLVVGGGFSGVTAALSAARQGAQTVLIEKQSFLGGTATLAMHQSICGLYGSGAKKAEDTLNDGIVREIVMSLNRDQGNKGFERIGEVSVFSYEGESLRKLLGEFIQREQNLDWFPETEIEEIQSDPTVIKSLTMRNREGRLTLTARCVIDCTGSGRVIELSGAEYSAAPVNERQLSGFSFRLAGVKTDSPNLSLKAAYALAKAAEEGRIERHLKWSTWNGDKLRGQGVVKLSVIPTENQKTIDTLKKDAQSVYACLKDGLSEFKDSILSQMGEAMAAREGLRMTGEYTLTAEDVLKGRKFKDGVVKSAWPLEFWDQHRGPRYQYLQHGDYYEIPTRCLRSKNIPNLFAAGRCISVTAEALASTRVSGTCLALGEQSANRAIAYLQGVPLLC